MLPAISILVYALAVARVTRLITSDRIAEAPRLRLTIRLWTWSIKPAYAETVRADDPGRDTWSVQEVRRQIAVERWADNADPPLPVYLLTCPWCVSVYVGVVAAPLVHLWGDSPWLFVPALALAFSHLTGLLSKLGE